MTDQDQKHYTPNHIPVAHRWGYSIAAIAALAYGGYGVLIDDLFIPGKRSRGVHLHGLEAWLVYGALICLAANLLAVVVDHFDQRNNETNYRRFAKVTSYLGWGLFFLGIFLPLIRKFA